MNYINRLFAILRNRGLRTTFVLVKIKLKSILELLIPQTIWGDRVGLRSVKQSLTDAEIEQIYAWSRDEEELRWTGGVSSTLTLQEFRNRIRHERWRPQSNQILFYIVEKSGELLGRAGLYTIDWNKFEGEFGITIDKVYWNKRYGREATKLFIQYVFQKTPIKRIYLGTYKENLRAQHSFAASGFRTIGSIRRFDPRVGKNVEGIQMEITPLDLQGKN